MRLATRGRTSTPKNSKRSKLSHLTSKMNKINGLMDNRESFELVDEQLNELSKRYDEVIHANDGVMLLLSEDEKGADQTFRFKPKKEQFSSFLTQVGQWITPTRQQHQDDVSPDDSV